MSLDQKDLELIERLIYKNADDVAVSIARSFERLEGHIDSTESRIYSRLSEIEDKVDSVRQDIADEMAEVRSEIREMARPRDTAEREETLDSRAEF